MSKGWSLSGLMAALLIVTQPAFAHGLLMRLAEDRGAIAGEVYYSSGARAAGEWVEISDLGAPDGTARHLQVDADGRFRAPGVAGHEYRVVALGEEGHSIEMTLKLLPASRGAMVVDGEEEAQGDGGWPPWAVIGGILAMSAIPALILRRRRPT